MLTPENDDVKVVAQKPTQNPVKAGVNEEGKLTTVEITATKVHTKQDIVNLTPWVEDVSSRSLNAILAASTGSAVSTTYFNTITAKDSIQAAVSENISSAYQQYCCIKEFPIYLDGEIEPSIEAGSKITTVSGSGTVIGAFPPSVADYLIIPMGYNKPSLFKVDSVKPASIWNGAHDIEFSMVETVLGETTQQLERKTAVTLNYIRSNHRLGYKYLLTDDEVKEQLDNEALVKQLEYQYENQFFNRDNDLFLVEVDGLTTMLDSELQNFVASSFSGMPNAYSDGTYRAEKPTVLSLLLEGKSKDAFPSCMAYARYMISNPRTDNPRLYGLLHANIGFLMIQKATLTKDIPMEHLEEFHVEYGGMSEGKFVSIKEIYKSKEDADKYRYIPDVAKNDTYIFSHSFYANKVPANFMEEVLLQYLTNGTCDRKMLYSVVARLETFNELEQYYLLPVIILLLRLAKDY